MESITYTQNQLREVAKKISLSVPSKCLAFYAPMGAGKTTLIKAIVAELGGLDEVSSPTFGLVNEYHDTNGKLLAYHFDFYRLRDEMEALDMGLEDYLNSDAWIFMEWPDKIPSFIPSNIVAIHIEILSSAERRISF